MKYAGSLHILNVKCKEQPTSVYLNSVWIRYSLHKQIQIKVVFRFFQVRSMEGTKLSSMCLVIYKCHMDHMQMQSARNPAKLLRFMTCLKWSDFFFKKGFGLNRNLMTWIQSVLPSFHLFWGQSLLPSSWPLSSWIQVWKSSCRFWRSDIILSSVCMLIAAWSCLVWWIWVPGS